MQRHSLFLVLLSLALASYALADKKSDASGVVLNYVFHSSQISTICYGGDVSSVDSDGPDVCSKGSAIAKLTNSPNSNTKGFGNFVALVRSLVKGAFTSAKAQKNSPMEITSVSIPTPPGNVNYFFVGDLPGSKTSPSCADIGKNFYRYDTNSKALTQVSATNLPSGISTASFLAPVYSGPYDSSIITVNLINTSPWNPISVMGAPPLTSNFFSTYTIPSNTLIPLATSGQSLVIPSLSKLLEVTPPTKDVYSSAVVYSVNATSSAYYDVYYIIYTAKYGVSGCPDPCIVSEFYYAAVPVTLSPSNWGTRKLLQSGSGGGTDTGTGNCTWYFINGHFVCL